MKYRALLVLALLLPLAAFAQKQLDKKYWTITLGADWDTLPVPMGDSVMMITNQDLDAAAWAHGLGNVQPATAQIYTSTLTQLYTQGYTRTDSSVKALGGKSFITTGWAGTGEDADSRVRIYVLQQGSFLFVTWLVYTSPDGDGSVAQFEAALATLQLKANGIFRQVAWNRKTDAARPRLDLLGRTWSPGTARVPNAQYFLRR